MNVVWALQVLLALALLLAGVMKATQPRQKLAAELGAHGPLVMNTTAQIAQAYADDRAGRFGE